MENEQVNKPDTSKRLPELDFKNELMIKLKQANTNDITSVKVLADEIISMFKNRGKYGKSTNCQCKDSQDSYAELSKGKPTGRIICFDCDKPYSGVLYGSVGTTNKPETDIVSLYWESDKPAIYWNSNSPGVSNFWYWNKLGKEFHVRACTCKGDLNDVEDIGTYDPTELYMITEGEYKGNVILKKHCKIQ